MNRVLVVSCLSILAVAACGPSTRDDCSPENLQVDVNNCGVCGRACTVDQGCVQGVCLDSACEPGIVEPCYSGPMGSENVGTCVGGMRTCTSAGTWDVCVGEVLPRQEVCGNGVDENCSGEADENVDLDGDGYTTCDGDCNDIPGSGELVNPGAFESNGNAIDDDCDGVSDNALAECDSGILSNTSDAMDFARSMDLCQTAGMASRRWGVIDAKLSLANGSMVVPDPSGHAVRPGFGTSMGPEHGMSLAVLSTGDAADSNDTMPNLIDLDQAHGVQTSPFPADWLAANGGTLPNVAGCPGPMGNVANDPEMLTMHVRVPSNAKSFSVKVNFFSKEFPDYTCTQYNDFFVVLLDSTYAGDPANPTDKNLAFYTSPTMDRYPVGVNLAYGNTGLFTECVNGSGGCSGSPQAPFNITTCTDSTQLAGTGFDDPEPFACDANALTGGGTGWLTTSGNVVGGEVITLRFAIWDTSDHVYDSTVLIDDFEWSVDVADPGTVIE